MDNLQAELDKLEDSRLDYVMARSVVNSDADGYKNAGIPKASFYKWAASERDYLNELAQRFKRETAARALRVIRDAAAEAAEVKVSGLKSRDERIKQAAASEILDRTVGKVPTEVDLKATVTAQIIQGASYADLQPDREQ